MMHGDGGELKANRDEEADFDSGEESDELDEIDRQILRQGVSQSAAHAKCILDLSFTKFKWNINEDLAYFHRPNIQSHFDIRRDQVSMEVEQEEISNQIGAMPDNNTHIEIDANGMIRATFGAVDPLKPTRSCIYPNLRV
jgi:hypothetical protein